MSVDIVIINADVQTLDKASDGFSAVGIDDGKIAFLGSTGAAKKIADSKTRVIDARGRVLLPGFIDAHTHFAYMGGPGRIPGPVRYGLEARSSCKDQEMRSLQGC